MIEGVWVKEIIVKSGQKTEVVLSTGQKLNGLTLVSATATNGDGESFELHGWIKHEDPSP